MEYIFLQNSHPHMTGKLEQVNKRLLELSE